MDPTAVGLATGTYAASQHEEDVGSEDHGSEDGLFSGGDDGDSDFD